MTPTRLSRRDRLRQRADRAARRDAEHLARFATRLSVATSHTGIVRAQALTVEQCVDDILAELAPRGTQADDIALVVVDLAPAPPPFDETVCARPEQVAGVRGRLREWLRHSFVDDGVADDIVIATNEAVANAIEHGSPAASAPISVRATRSDGTVRVEVVDTGSLVAHHDDPHRGRGVAMMRALMDQVEISPSLVGTTVCLERRLH